MNTKVNSRFSCTLRIFIQIILFELSSNMILPNSATKDAEIMDNATKSNITK